MNTDTSKAIPKQIVFTIIFLCLGYFIDFYDLTIFSATYAPTLKDLFHMTDTLKIQSLYLTITNIYTVGILLGAISCGILGDKFGRAYIIKYNILIYSLATILSVFAKSIVIFSILKFISGFGLATEFATSSVLISEILTTKKTSWSTKWLYIAGILGGVSAVLVCKIFSWQMVYIFGGSAGILLFFI